MQHISRLPLARGFSARPCCSCRRPRRHVRRRAGPGRRGVRSRRRPVPPGQSLLRRVRRRGRRRRPGQSVLLPVHVLQVQLPVRQPRALLRRQRVHDRRISATCVGQCNQGTPAAAGTTCGDPTSTECNLADTCNGSRSVRRQPAAPSGHPAAARRPRADATPTISATAPEPASPRPCRRAPGSHAVQRRRLLHGRSVQRVGRLPAPWRRRQGRPAAARAITQCDLADTCNGSGTCLPNNRPNGFACNDGLTCTTTDACQGGTCTGSGDPCAGHPVCQNFCNEPGGSCTAPAGTSCDEGNDCNGINTCNGAGTCVIGTPLPDGSQLRRSQPLHHRSPCAPGRSARAAPPTWGSAG